MAKKWRLTWADQVYDEDDLTIAECEAAEDLLGLSWLRINPISFAKHARGVLAVVVAARTGADQREVFAEVGKLKASEFVARHITLVDDDMPGSYADGFPPVPAGERSTSTS